MLHGKVVVLESNGPACQHVRGILHLVQVGQCLVVGTTREVSTPKGMVASGSTPRLQHSILSRLHCIDDDF